MDLQTLLTQYLVLAGVAAFIAALINALKFFGIVPDGAAPTVSLVLNAVGFLLFVAAHVVGFDGVTGIDAALSGLASVILAILGLLGQIGISKAINAGLRGAPVIGFSHRLKNGIVAR